MSILSAQTVKLKPSPSYTRLLLVVYLISVALICSIPTYVLAKCCLICILSWYLMFYVDHKSPCPEVKELSISMRQWQLISTKAQIKTFDEVLIIIHNELFQLIELTSNSSKKLLVVFNDQVSESQLKAMHVKIINSSRKRLLLKKHMLK